MTDAILVVTVNRGKSLLQRLLFAVGSECLYQISNIFESLYQNVWFRSIDTRYKYRLRVIYCENVFHEFPNKETKFVLSENDLDIEQSQKLTPNNFWIKSHSYYLIEFVYGNIIYLLVFIILFIYLFIY